MYNTNFVVRYRDIQNELINNLHRMEMKKQAKEKEKELELTSSIEDLIFSNVFLRYVPYGDGDQEKDPESVEDAAKEIVKMLKDKKII